MSLKEQLKNSALNLQERLKESAWYASLSDRYEGLSPNQQKMTWILGGLLVLLVTLYIPLTMLTTSSENLGRYENQRQLIRDMFKAYRDSSSQSQVPVPPTGEALKSAIQASLDQARLLPEQVTGVAESFLDGQLIPAALIGSVYEVKLSKLNIKQIVDIGASLQSISSSVKMKDMSILANSTDPRYFDVNYKVFSLKVPEAEPAALPELPPTRSRNNNNSRD